jgi:hypothetical protein
VRFARAARYVFVPSYIVNCDFLLGAMFVRQTTRTYYFGDYFDARYGRAGFVPWFEYHPARAVNVADVNFAYYRHLFANTKTWELNLRSLYAARTRNEVPRPPHTLAQQTQAINTLSTNKRHDVAVSQAINITHAQNVGVLSPVAKVHNTTVTGLATLGGPRIEGAEAAKKVVKMQSVNQEQRAAVQQSAALAREVSAKRQQAEAKLVTGTPAAQPRPLKPEVPKSATPTPVPRPEAKAPTRVKQPPTAPTLPKTQPHPSAAPTSVPKSKGADERHAAPAAQPKAPEREPIPHPAQPGPGPKPPVATPAPKTPAPPTPGGPKPKEKDKEKGGDGGPKNHAGTLA